MVLVIKRERKEEMKNKIIAICLIILIVCFSGFAFYFWFNYFLNLGSDGKLAGTSTEKDLIVLIDENKLYSTYKEGIEEPINVDGYKFRIENRSSKSARYNLVFNEISPNQVNDGCTNKTLLKRDELNYQLLFNNEVISQGRLNQLQNDILDIRNINGDSKNSYELKVWLNSSSENNDGKHFHYKVELKVIE